MATIIGARVPTSAVVQPNDGLGNILSLLARPYLDTLTNDIKREQLIGLEGKNQRVNAAVNAVRNPDQIDYNALAAASVAGDIDPRKGIGQLIAVRNANTLGANDPRTTNALVGVGENYNTTFHGMQQHLANDLAKAKAQEETKINVAGMTPETVVVNGVPTIVPRKDSYGQQASVPVTQVQGALLQKNFPVLDTLNPQQQKALDALPPTDKVMNYIHRDPVSGEMFQGRTIDGKTDMTTRIPLPQGAQLVNPMNAGGSNAMLGPFAPDNTEMRQLRGRFQSNQSFADTADEIVKMVEQSPEIIGPTGVAMRMAKNLSSVANDVGRLFGSQQKFEAQTQEIARELQGKGISPNIISNLANPDVSNVVRLNHYLAYKWAQAFAGQDGREISDKDFQAALRALGNPDSVMEGSNSYLEGLKKWSQIARDNSKKFEEQLRKGDVRLQAPNTQQNQKPDDPLGLR